MRTVFLLAAFFLGTVTAVVAQAWDADFQDNMDIKPHLLHPILELRAGLFDNPMGKQFGASGGGGIEIRYKRSTSLLLSSINKAGSNTQPFSGTDVNSYYNFAKYAYAGGGVFAGKLGANASRAFLHPYLGFGYGDSDLSVTFNWLFPGTDQEARVKGVRLDFTMATSETPRWYWVSSIGIYSARCQGCTIPSSPMEVSTGVRYRF